MDFIISFPRSSVGTIKEVFNPHGFIMSLIVARQVNDDIYIVGDTKFSQPDNSDWSRSRQYLGGLKAVILNPGLCVCFAGTIHYAQDAIQGIYDKAVNLFDKNAAIDYFLRYHLDSFNEDSPDDSTDFLIACIVEKADAPGYFTKEIFRIADGQVFFENEATRIGDQQAFREFQRISLQDPASVPVSTFEISRLGPIPRPLFDASLATSMRAMQHVIDSTQFASVDGIRTVVVSESDQFRYLEYVLVRGDPSPIGVQHPSQITFGGSARGADERHVGVFGALGHGIFPAYSYSGNFGIIYHPEKNFNPSVLPYNSFEDFQADVRLRVTEAHERALAYQSRIFG
jgi:hypothetical protein